MKILKNSLSLVALTAFAFNPLFADPVADVDNLIQNANELRTKFNSGVTSTNIFENVLLELNATSDKAVKDFNEIDKNIYTSCTHIKNLKRSLSALKVSIDSDIKDLEISSSALAKVMKSFPVGDAKLKEIRELISATRKQVELNPGNNYQDKNYFDTIVNEFESAARLFKKELAESYSISTISSVNTPRIEGIKSTIAMVEDYLKKSESQQANNLSDIKSFTSSVNEFADTYAREKKRYGELVKKYDVALCDVSVSFFDVSKLLLDNVPMSATLKNQPEFKLHNLNNITRAKSKFSSVSLSKAEGSVMANKPVKSANSFWARDASYDLKLSKGNPQKNANIRAEILSVCSQIASVTRTLTTSSSLIASINNNVNASISVIKENEVNLSALLKDSISEFSSIQMVSSKILIFKIYIETTKAQNEISLAKMNTAFDDTVRDFDIARKSASEISETAKKLSKSFK